MEFEKELHDLYLMQQTYGTLFSFINRLQISGDQYLGSMTSRQFMAITALLHLPEDEATINNIARKLGTSKQNANRMIAGMEKLGYLSISPSQKDKRASNVRLTSLGKDRMIECSEKMVIFMADIFQKLNTSELETLWNILKKLYGPEENGHSGFEEAAAPLTDDGEMVTALLKKFADRRNKE